MRTLHARMTLSYFKQEKRILRLRKMRKRFNLLVFGYEGVGHTLNITIARAKITVLLQCNELTDHSVNLISIDIARLLQLIKEEKDKEENTMIKKMLRLFSLSFGTVEKCIYDK